jgi:hypothetical protein
LWQSISGTNGCSAMAIAVCLHILLSNITVQCFICMSEGAKIVFTRFWRAFVVSFQRPQEGRWHSLGLLYIDRVEAPVDSQYT